MKQQWNRNYARVASRNITRSKKKKEKQEWSERHKYVKTLANREKKFFFLNIQAVSKMRVLILTRSKAY
jgi:hypothetical protein